MVDRLDCLIRTYMTENDRRADAYLRQQGANIPQKLQWVAGEDFSERVAHYRGGWREERKAFFNAAADRCESRNTVISPDDAQTVFH